MGNLSKKNQLIEVRTIDFIPEEERHGSLWSQFTLWLGANLHITTIITGALAVVFGGDVLWSLVGLCIGQLFGMTVMALHAAQGPKIGLPQMISSRVQFGILGACIPIALVCLMYLGFTATGILFSGQALAELFHLPVIYGIILFAAIIIIVASFGYRLIHITGRIASVVGVIVFAYLFITILSHANMGALLANHHFDWGNFVFAMSLSASWQIAFGPYVADYSRYLPSKTSSSSVFWAVGLGSFIGSQAAMVLGVFIGAMAGKSFLGQEVNAVVQLTGASGFIVALLLLSIPFGKITISVLNAYGTFMCMTTITSSFTGRKAYTKLHRLFIVTIMIIISCILAILGAKYGFLKAFKGFLLFLLTFFIPWSAINLVDYYNFSKDHIHKEALTDKKGIYGSWNPIGVGSYIFGVLIQFPFIDSPFYTGFISKSMGNIDLSWLVGIIVTALVYYFLAKKYDHRIKIA